jgi:hypothetical protein
MRWEDRHGIAQEQMDSFMTAEEEAEYEEYMASECDDFDEDLLREQWEASLAWERNMAEPWWAR